MASIDARLQRAQELALRSDQRLDRLFLSPFALPVSEALIDARAILTIEGASSLEISLFDPDWRVENSGVLDRNDDGHMDTVDIFLDSLAFRLAAAQRTDPDTLQLTFEDRAVQLMRAHNTPLTVSRGKMTRAGFIEKMVREVKTHPIPFWSPEKGIKQPIARADYPDATPAPASSGSNSDSGFDQGAKLTVKGQPADAEQRRQIETVLTVADQEDAGPKATLALVVAGIGESSFRRSSTQPRTKAHGVFQLIPETARSTGLNPEDTEATARYFLRHGYYKYGGAVKLARDNPDMSVGEIVSRVEGSDAGGAWYQDYAAEARKIVAAWNRGSSSGGTREDVVRVKTYPFMRGAPDGPSGEDSFEASTRLAEQVNWRFFVAAGIAAFISDDRLMAARAAVAIDSPHDDGLLERPTYDWDHGKLAGEVQVRIDVNRWAIPPGSVWALRGGFGPVEGRWIAHTIEQNLLDVTDTRVTLIKPLSPRKEPAPEVTTSTKKKDAGSPASSSNVPAGGHESNGETGPGPAHDARGIKASAGASSRLTKWTNPDGSVIWVCTWMVAQLKYAKRNGWSGHLTEGWRSRTTEEVYWDRYGHDPGLAARPGTSNHGLTIHPGGAIDTSDPSGLAKGLDGWSLTPAAMKGNGVRLPRDVVHFSATGE